MKVKRFFAATMSAALKQVRESMGDDAVILSSRRVDGGVEIVTALDYDENMARQKLGDAAVDATSDGRLAELQAEQHLRLQDELDRSRSRIRHLREQRGGYEPRQRHEELQDHLDTESLPSLSENRQPEAAGAQVDNAEGAGSNELAAMRRELDSLRAMISEQGTGAVASFASSQEHTPEAPDAVRKRLAERLEEFGMSSTLADTLARQSGRGKLEDNWKRALRTLAAGLKTGNSDWATRGGIYALVGPTGSGKTTTIGKIAAQYVLEHGADSLALVTTDRYRVAAHEQLFVFGRILNVPVRVVDDSHSLDDVLDELEGRHMVLIDTAGLSGADPGCQEQLAELANSRHRVSPHLVVPATSQPRIMKSMWHCYKMSGLAGCIMTKLDEALTLGEVLGFALETALPVAWVTDGQKIPQDLHPANAASLVRLGVERLRDVRKQQTMAEGA
ncbi:flagellar biosynthesis protein FlhF [Marinobacter bryozoorum]|jgi:flagellar biosynthesis protein FlhF|uniref:flagellar biosynthesis protein FlhF n=1 Tax=Marinobacter bryozoorum TaxID=256324 RepID=UPI0020037BBD|nr:flagellar biosynthesis protein FlhF [Marinobacter bryozoorum]MCK7543437.1 flagellar biosynthesis protein FlhF [Marinobacter bryozoorum]